MRADEAIKDATIAMHRSGAYKVLKAERAKLLAVELAGTILDAYLEGYRAAWCDGQSSLNKALEAMKIT